MQAGRLPAHINLAELSAHRVTLEEQADALRRQLNKGVPRAEFRQLHALSRAVGRAASVLGEIQSTAED